MHRLVFSSLWLCLAMAAAFAGPPGPVWLEDRFELPEGFHLYRAATAALSGGSYALAFDGEGRMLVGDGTAVRRLSDDDHDGVYDRFEVIATGLGPRGPQGVLVLDDTRYAIMPAMSAATEAGMACSGSPAIVRAVRCSTEGVSVRRFEPAAITTRTPSCAGMTAGSISWPAMDPA